VVLDVFVPAREEYRDAAAPGRAIDATDTEA
jgi:hypothetical protein